MTSAEAFCILTGSVQAINEKRGAFSNICLSILCWTWRLQAIQYLCSMQMHIHYNNVGKFTRNIMSNNFTFLRIHKKKPFGCMLINVLPLSIKYSKLFVIITDKGMFCQSYVRNLKTFFNLFRSTFFEFRGKELKR